MNELKIKLNSGELGAVFSKKIEGVLKAVIIRSERPVNVEIVSEYGYIIYRALQRIGNEYFSLKCTPRDAKDHQMNFIGEDYYINEDVVFAASGARNVDVEIILRFA